MRSEILARVLRGQTLESVHRGHFVVMDGDKTVLSAAGDPETVTFFRSACKAFQALPFITSGGAEHFGFSEEEIALACASHSGEPMHVKVAASMLEKAGFSETDLRCGTHLPFNDTEAKRMLATGERPTQLHNNCSGKHAAMLAFAKYIGADPKTYEAISNPIQQEILKNIAMFAELPVESISIGVDGCAVPNFAMPVSAMARCFANLINPPKAFGEDIRNACSRIVSAMTHHPQLIGGTERLDTLLMEAAPGKVISKVGAEGVWLCGILPNEKYPKGLAIALKIEDGDDKRARPVVAIELMRQLGMISRDQLTEHSPSSIKNRRGDEVGRVVANIEPAQICNVSE
jgi:L-asparaginase II